MSDHIPKPWEAGYSVSKLPSAPLTRVTKGPDGRQNNGKNFGDRAMKHLSKEERKKAKEKEIATKKAKAASNIARRKKIDAKHLRSAEEMLEKHNFDPMDLLMDVAQGNALYDDHPFLPVLHRYLADVKDRLDNEDGFGVKGLLEQLRVESYGYLKDSYTPKEHRIRVAMELMQYVRPKKKQVEHSGTTNQGPVVVQPLTKEEVENFKVWFDDNF